MVTLATELQYTSGPESGCMHHYRYPSETIFVNQQYRRKNTDGHIT